MTKQMAAAANKRTNQTGNTGIVFSVSILSDICTEAMGVGVLDGELLGGAEFVAVSMAFFVSRGF
ncbi:MAG: hypothetical protein RR580_06825 [Christensenellaceae bacterium]